MAENPTPELVEVEIQGGVKAQVPADAAAKYREARAKDKAEREQLAQRVGAIEAEKRAAEEAKRKAEEDRQLTEAAKAGEIEKVRAMLQQQREREVRERDEELRDTKLFAELARNPDILSDAAEDIAQQLRLSCLYDPSTRKVVAVDAAGKPRVGQDGKPLGVDALVSEFLSNRPWFRKPAGVQGSGAGGSGQPGTTPKTMSKAQWEALNKQDAAASAKFFAEGGKLTD